MQCLYRCCHHHIRLTLSLILTIHRTDIQFIKESVITAFWQLSLKRSSITRPGNYRHCLPSRYAARLIFSSIEWTVSLMNQWKKWSLWDILYLIYFLIRTVMKLYTHFFEFHILGDFHFLLATHGLTPACSNLNMDFLINLNWCNHWDIGDIFTPRQTLKYILKNV